MIFLLISIFVPVATYLLLPLVVASTTKKQPGHRKLLILACILFFISWYLPSPLINGEDTAFTTHVIGGGVFSGVLWLYLKNNFGWKQSLLVEAASLFAFTCTLGVLNELAEFTLVRIGAARLSLADTSLDLVANTLGMLVFFTIYLAPRLYQDHSRR